MKKKIQKIKVFFDTNVLYTKNEADLIRNEIKELIRQNTSHVDLDISWHLPKVVIEERRYQMLARSIELLPNLRKLEKLIGHEFAVKEDTLEMYVEKAISEAVSEFSLVSSDIDVGKVNWSEIIRRSTSRMPPFEVGEKEKGFRDAIIAQSFFQEHHDSPSTPSICLLVFVSDDRMLSAYISEVTSEAKNVRVLDSIADLENLINTLTSSVTEDFVRELARKAEKLFFTKNDDKAIYYKENIKELISNEFISELRDTNMPGKLKKNTTWWISSPIFFKKVRQRVHWITAIEPEFEIYHYESLRNNFPSLDNYSEVGDLFHSYSSGKSVSENFRTEQLGLPSFEENIVVDLKGKDQFEVYWSANTTKAGGLTRPAIESIKYVGSNIADS